MAIFGATPAMVSSLLLASLLTCCSMGGFSSQRLAEDGTRAPSPLGQDPFLSQVPEMPTDLAMNSSSLDGLVSTTGLASTSTLPCSSKDTGGIRCRFSVPPQSHSQTNSTDLMDLFDKFFKPGPSVVAVPGPSLFTLRDISQKVIRRHHNRLVASPQMANAPPEKISVVPNQFMEPKHFPIIMGIDEGTRCLSCGTAAQPTLMLEHKNIMDLYQNSQEAKRFTFTCSVQGSIHRFESVAFPGWYLSTSPRNDQPLRVTNRPGEGEITSFYFKKI